MKKFSQADQTINHNLYKNFLELGMDDGWTVEDKLGNFELFLEITKLTNYPIQQASVLDVGSGTGDFAYFIHKHQVKKYLGVEIFEPAVKKAKEKYPFAEFIVGDFLATDFDKFDFVFASGALTTSFNTDNYIVLEHWVNKMWQLAKKGIVFNVLLKRFEADREPNLFLYDKQRVLEIAAKIAPEANMKIVITDAGCGDGTEELHVFLYQ